MKYQLTIKREGSMAPGITGDVTDNQRSMIIALLKAEDLSYGELLAFLAKRRKNYDAPFGAGDNVEAYRG